MNGRDLHAAAPRFPAPLFAAALFAAASLAGGAARAGTFDTRGEYLPDPGAAAFVDFSSAPDRYLLQNGDPSCAEPMFQLVTQDDALDGDGLLHLQVNPDCAERLLVALPRGKGAYSASLWTRHGGLSAQLVALYPDETGVPPQVAWLYPTGRATSDGWIELASNPLSVDADLATATYLKIADYASMEGVDVDALEIVREADFQPPSACSGHDDPACGPGGRCIFNQCVLGRISVPRLPDPSIRDAVVDMLASRVRLFYGGHRSRADYLPEALARIEAMRGAADAFSFWDGLAAAIAALHDWHTLARGGPATGLSPRHRLNACFVEGDADSSQAAWPKDPRFADILVSHAGGGAAGLHQGDRLVAVDGMHPIAWVASLADIEWGFSNATDPDVFGDYAERLGGPAWLGGALIVKYATSFTVIRCDAASGTCAGAPETLAVEDLPNGGGSEVACDNRPLYGLEPSANPPDDHHVFYDFYRGRVAGTTEDEAIFGMIWDTLYGGGDPNGWVNSHLSEAIADWKANARGVILDHRTGNGGTLDTPELVTTLVRPPSTAAVVRMPISFGGWDGPEDDAEGQAIFEAKKGIAPYDVGSADHDPDLPVALLIHRDGSASDYLPLGMKGAPKTRIFGPHATNGAFSTFIELDLGGGMSFQMASGDTIASDGRALIGHGVEPDEVVAPKQSDLLMGRDTVFEAALAWVRQELKP